MEKQESGSGALLIRSIREQFHDKVPSKALRLVLILASALLLIALAVGIVFGCIAIGSCHAAPVEGRAQPVENAINKPGSIPQSAAS